MNKNQVLPLLTAIAVLTTILVAPAAASVLGEVLFVGGIVALMARDYKRSPRTSVMQTASNENALRLAA